MPTKKISELTSATQANPEDVLPIVQGNKTKKIPVSVLVGAGGGGSADLTNVLQSANNIIPNGTDITTLDGNKTYFVVALEENFTLQNMPEGYEYSPSYFGMLEVIKESVPVDGDSIPVRFYRLSQMEMDQGIIRTTQSYEGYLVGNELTWSNRNGAKLLNIGDDTLEVVLNDITTSGDYLLFGSFAQVCSVIGGRWTDILINNNKKLFCSAYSSFNDIYTKVRVVNTGEAIVQVLENVCISFATAVDESTGYAQFYGFDVIGNLARRYENGEWTDFMYTLDQIDTFRNFKGMVNYEYGVTPYFPYTALTFQNASFSLEECKHSDRPAFAPEISEIASVSNAWVKYTFSWDFTGEGNITVFCKAIHTTNDNNRYNKVKNFMCNISLSQINGTSNDPLSTATWYPV